MITSLAMILMAYGHPALDRKIQGANDLEPMGPLAGTRVFAMARPVARAERAFDEYGFCTASRVGERLFLTNYHCEQPCAATQFRLGYVDGAPASRQPLLKCTRLVRKSLQFDYALYEAEPVDAESARLATGFPVLKLWDGPLRDGQRVYAPSHPLGKPMEVDRSAACVISEATPFLSPTGRMTAKHMCDSEGSSSGAPLLDPETGHALALHWGGLSGEYNEAIPMELVLADLRANVPGVLARLTIVRP